MSNQARNLSLSAQRPQRISLDNSVLSAPSPVNTKWEWIVVISVMMFAAAFRLVALNDVPPGLHHDEVIIGQAAKDILRGHLSIYFTGGYGQEPLYHYLTAGMFAAIGANAFVLRLTSAFIGLIGLAITYRFTRKLFSPIVAIGTLAWMSISLWPIFFSRVGLRGISLPVLTMLSAYFLWRALERRETGSRGQGAGQFVIAGILLGLSIYTYQASRVFPIIFLVFFVYLFITQRISRSHITLHSPLITNHSIRSFILFFVSALIIAAPLIIYLTAINPSAEQRIGDLSEPLNKLVAGDPSEVIQSTLNTLGMFTVRGDAVPIYNVSDRPVFPEPIGAAMFYFGWLACVWRWKKPQYALMLIWFFISLGPAMVTPFSPNFVRTIASWPTPFVFAGIGMNEVMQFASSMLSKGSGIRDQGSGHRAFSLSRILAAFFAMVLIYNAASTARDYFINWPTGDYVRFWQQATWTQAVRTLNADPSDETVAASGLSIHDFDPQTFDLLGLRSDIKVKWFDCRNAMLFPSMTGSTRYLVPDFFPCDADLWQQYLSGARLIAQPRWPDSGNTIFSLYEFNSYQLYVGSIRELTNISTWFIGSEEFDAKNPEADLIQANGIDFSGLNFFGYIFDRKAVQPGDTVEIQTVWKVTAPLVPPLSIFVHITAPDGSIIAQWDGLDVGVASLEPYDLFVQRHRIQIPASAPIGPYRISLGVYHPDSGVRLKTTIDDQTIDSIVLGTLTVTK